MADPDGDDDKQHEPTQKRLDDARKKGEVPRSTDLTTAAAYGGLLVVALAVGGRSLERIGASLAGLIARADSLSTDAFGGGGLVMTGGLMAEIGGALSTWFLIPAAAALGVLVVQRAIVFAPEKLNLKLSRISPLSNAKNKYGRSGLFEFAKSFVKLTIYSVLLGIFLWRALPKIVGAVAYNEQAVVGLLFEQAIGFLATVLVIAAVIGGIDFLWQRAEHLRKNRMSHKELTDEVKQSEGDPHLKQKRRQKAYDIAMNQMLADVPDADVVIVNPTHYAVALRWSRMPGAAPICIAKGTDEIAARIREVADEAGVPIHRDPPTARAIHAVVEIGQEIQPEHYQPVAAAIRFAEGIRARARAMGRGRPDTRR